MKAVLFEQFGQAPRVQNVPDPTPTAQGVVVKVEATGLCRSDWHGWMGHDPGITAAACARAMNWRDRSWRSETRSRNGARATA